MNDSYGYEKSKRPAMMELLHKYAMYIMVVEESNEEQDTKQATDFILRVKGGTVASRIRRFDPRLYRDLTIRVQSQHGGRTEIDKLRDGWGDYYIYAWEDRDGNVCDSALIDINAMRDQGLFDKDQKWLERRIPNRSDHTWFCVMTIDELDDRGCVIARGVV